LNYPDDTHQDCSIGGVKRAFGNYDRETVGVLTERIDHRHVGGMRYNGERIGRANRELLARERDELSFSFTLTTTGRKGRPLL